MCGYCAIGGGSRGGGVFGPLGTTVPWGDSPREGRAAHGPLHPAVRIPLGFCRGLCQVVFWLFRSLSVLMLKAFVFLRGWCVFWHLEPFKTRPVFGFLSVSPLFSFLWFVRRRRVFFLLSFSQALGQPKPFWFGFPLVFSSSGTRTPLSTRTSCSTPTPRPRPAPVFFSFFFVVVARFPVRVFLVLVLLMLGFLVGVFVSGFGRFSMLDVLMHL